MATFEKCFCATLLLIAGFSITSGDRNRVHKITSPTSLQMPYNDETVLTCEMNIAADSFQWRYYPLGVAQASNPNAPLVLGKENYIEIPRLNYIVEKEKKKSTLTIKSTNESKAGDYQCLAHFGASVSASIPDRITITTLGNFPNQENKYITVTEGNTVVWRCDPPYSNPPAYIDYSKNGALLPPNQVVSVTSLILSNVTAANSGTYKCRALNAILQKQLESHVSLHLHVIKPTSNELPRFIIPQRTSYTVKKGDSVFLECGAIGTPVPTVSWEKRTGQMQPNRTEMFPGGLQISNIVSSDDGVYVCRVKNSEGTISHSITLIYNEAPTVTKGPKSGDIDEGDELELECTVQGTPEPQISWLLNGKSVLNDHNIEAIGKRIYFRPIEKRHAGIIQCFATNAVGTAYSSADWRVIPKQKTDLSDPTTQPPPGHRKAHKGGKGKGNRKNYKGTSEMIPPQKPTISRLNDESVVIRWVVPPNEGLPISFFKVQWRELGPVNYDDGYGRGRSSRWKTKDVDIVPNIRSFELNGLKPDHVYKFRVAAVYSNNDNKLSPKSDKFHLNRGDFSFRNPLPIPKLTFTETVNATSIRIYWEYIPSPNITVDGFYINYMSASSAGDYMKATADGDKTSTYVITHLSPDTVYDIKMQSFNIKTASDFSPILKQKTEKLSTNTIEPTTIKNIKPPAEPSTDSNLYIFIGAGVTLVALLLSGIVFLLICRKWKQNKDANRGDRTDKPAVEEINHHIQADANDYVVSPKNLPRNNGCMLPPNRITITANPLADADNKSQNMIEMSCLSSQNNNCTASARIQETQDPQQSAASKGTGKHKNRETKRRKPNIDLSGENYV